MKPGDMVILRESPQSTRDKFLWMYGGDSDVPWNENGTLISTDIPYREGDVGVVIGSSELDLDGTYLKLLTPTGIGWVRKLWLRSI